MKQILCIFLMVLILFGCKTKKVYNQVKFDEKLNSDILYGYTTMEGLKKEPFKTWFDFEHENYQADMPTLEQIGAELLDETEIVLVMATWCSDSRREVPRFLKILESVGYKPDRITIINVDREKKADKTLVENLNIERVPTFIFSKHGKETGRIIETPQESLEKDLLKIIRG